MEGDALALPFPDESFDVVIISEVMEHIPDDKGVLAEMVRVLKPGGRIAITVPRYGPEKVCWTLSDAYHEVEGGHIRIYKADELLGKIREAGPASPTAPTTPTRLHSPVLVAQVRVRRGQRQGAAGAGVPQAAGLGHHEEAAGHPGRRAGAQPADRQELRGVRDQAAPARAAPAGRRGGRHVTTPRTEHLVLPGVLTAEQAAATVARHPRGAARGRGHPVVPRATTSTRGTTPRPRWRWTRPGEHEAAERAYAWLAAPPERGRLLVRRRTPTATADDVTDRGRETNFCAYIAVGVWHHYLATGDDTFLDRMWPTVYAAVEFVLRLQQPGGQIGWKREDDGTRRRRRAADREFVRSTRRCAARSPSPSSAKSRSPTGSWRPARCGHAIRRHPERFLDKDRYSMDWYYPVLGGALTRRRGQGPYRGGLGRASSCPDSGCAASCPTRG